MSSKSILTFVTSILNIYDEENEYTIKKNIPWRVERFRELAQTGIQLCVYVSPEIEPLIRQIEEEFSQNVKIMRVLKCKETMISQMLSDHCPNGYRLPENRNPEKDNANYSIVINSKTEFMSHTIQQNPWDSTHFAWIDFNITYVFSKKDYTYEMLKWMGSQSYIKSKCFVNPGCWQKYNNTNSYEITDRIHWRFCGGFFLGDKDSILKFHELYLEYFPRFLRTYGVLVWEVNFWAWLETNSDWNPQWYLADHNDTIVNDIWAEIFTKALSSNNIEKITYDYPIISTYNASSASYLLILENNQPKHYLNTRYLNYLYHDLGYYQFYDQNAIIRNRNYFSELDEHTLLPKNYIEVAETIDLPEYEHGSRNIEDIRLYSYNGKIKYIATTMGYYSTGGTRMIVGDYCINKTENGISVHYENSRLIHSPENQHCEKNWIPLVIQNPNSPYYNRELFIYRWSPLEIGELCESSEMLDLKIIARFDTSSRNPFFWKMKGSTPFVDTGEYLVGVVHFTEDTSPRHYFHMLVILDRMTLQPLRYSDPFCFEQVSIEFCIGFTIRDGQYLFWISRMDRDPILVKINMDKIPVYRNFV